MNVHAKSGYRIFVVVHGMELISGIGPLMFLISTKELAEILDRAGVKVKLFADDIEVYVQIVSRHDSDRPQATVRVGLAQT